MRSFSHLVIVYFGLLLWLTGCNMPARVAVSTPEATGAFQTLAAQLATTPSADGIAPSETAGGTPSATLVNAGHNQTSTQAPRCDQAAAAYPKIDITIEDDTVMQPGQAFTKIWRVVNTGSCTWDADYNIVWFSGDRMNAGTSQNLPVHVPPGQSVDVAVEMQAPISAGTYQGNWKLRNAAGVLFGIGPNGESPFWVRIKVNPEDTPSPSPTLTASPTPEIQASGPIRLGLGEHLDLDHLSINAGVVDLVFEMQPTTAGQYQLAPLGSASIALYGIERPNIDTCQGMDLSNMPIAINELAPASYLCYRTDLGLPGWVKIEQFDPDAGSVILQILTWKLP